MPDEDQTPTHTAAESIDASPSPQKNNETRNLIVDLRSRISAAPLADADHIYIGLADSTVLALNAADCSQKWRYHADGPVDAPPYSANGSLYICSKNHSLHVIDLITGLARWTCRPEGRLFKTESIAPVVSKGSVIFPAADGFVYSLDENTGVINWRTKCEFAECSPVADSRVVVVVTSTGQIRVIDLQTGEDKWDVELEDTGNPILDSDVLLFTSEKGIHALTASTGDAVWHHDTFSQIDYLTKAGNTLICSYARSGIMKSVDPADGKELWNIGIEGEVTTRPLIEGNTVYVGTSKGFYYAIGAATGEIIWKFRFRCKILDPVIAGNRLFITDETGNLYSLDLCGPEHPPVETLSPNAQAAWHLYPLMLFTSFLYEFYWFYRNWKDFEGSWQKRFRPAIYLLGLYSPVLFGFVYGIYLAASRSSFGETFFIGAGAMGLFVYYLQWTQFNDIRDEAKITGVKNFRLLFVSTAFFSLSVMGFGAARVWAYFREPSGAFDLLAIFALGLVANLLRISVVASVQKTLNRIWQAKSPGLTIRKYFTRGEKILLVVFGLLFSLGVVGTVAGSLAGGGTSPTSFGNFRADTEPGTGALKHFKVTEFDEDWNTYESIDIKPGFTIRLPAAWRPILFDETIRENLDRKVIVVDDLSSVYIAVASSMGEINVEQHLEHSQKDPPQGVAWLTRSIVQLPAAKAYLLQYGKTLDDSGDALDIYFAQYAIIKDGKTIYISLTVPADQQEEIKPTFEAIGQSFNWKSG